MSESPYAVAKMVREEYGNWMLSECDCLDDMIWKVYPEFSKWDKEKRDEFTAQVYEVIFG